jgi:hypothetical protein
MISQGGFQNQQFGSQQSSIQANKYQPLGFVQAQYQGGIRKQNAGPVISHLGFSAGQQQNTSQFANQSIAQNRSFVGSQQQNFAQPVIAHAGYTAGQENQSAQSASGVNYGPTNAIRFNQSEQPVIAHAGSTAARYGQQAQFGQQSGMVASQGFSQFSQAGAHSNPVYQATNASTQEGPVLAKLGYTAGQQQAGFGASAQSFNQFSQASSQSNPVYQATNASAQDGPVLSKLGYTAGHQSGEA